MSGGLDFGTRLCPLCEKEIDAPVFGMHITQHRDDELERWPGGIPGVMADLADSLDASLAVAEDAGETDTADKLRAARDLLRSMAQ